MKIKFLPEFSYLFLSAFLLISCVPKNGSVKSNINSKLSTPSTSQSMDSVSVSSVEIVNNQLVITGRNFDNVKKIKVEGPYLNENFTIESITSSRIVANAMKAVQIGVNGVMGMQGVFNLIMSDANAAATFAVSFTLQDRSVTANKLSSMGAQIGQVLKFNGTTWVPSNLSSSQLFLGTYDASTDQIVGSGASLSSIAANAGDYFIVTVAGVYNSVTYPVNSWIMYNGTSWELISNGESFVSSFKGRRGVVVPAKGDYTLGQMNDVTLTAPANNDVLTYESATSQWKALQLPLRSVTATAPVVSSGGQTTDISLADTTAKNLILAGPVAAGGAVTYRALDVSDLPVISSYVAGVTAKTGIANTDTIPQALGKVQGYLNALEGSYVSKDVGATSTVEGTVTFSSGVFTTPQLFLTNTPLVTDTTAAANVDFVTSYVATMGNWEKGTIPTVATSADVAHVVGNVGIGTREPQTKLNIVEETSAEYQIQIDRFSGTLGTAPLASGIRLNTARGTIGASEAAHSGDILGKIDFGSSDSATNITEGAIIRGEASALWASGQHPTDIVFLTSPNSVSSPLERMRIHANGDVTIAGVLSANSLKGYGAQITGIAGTSGGVTNSQNTNIQAGTDLTDTIGDISFATHGISRMTITNSGLVSIGANANSGGIFSVSGSGNTELFRVSDNGTATNYAEITGGSTAAGPVFAANGSALDIGLNISSKGAGDLILNGTGTGRVGIGKTSPGSALDVKGTLRLSGSTSGYVGFAPAAAAGSTTYTLPSADAVINGQVLSSNAAGVLSWQSIMDGKLTTYGDAAAVKPTVSQDDSITTAFGKVQKFLKDIDTDYLSKSKDQTINGTLAINSLTGFIKVPTPVLPDDAVSKAYVDSFGLWQKGTNTADVARITGNVGIGTAEPLSSLHIKTGSSSLMRFERTGVTPVMGFELGGNTFGLYDYTNLQYRWRTVNTNGQDLALLESGGKVGIGTTNPATKLNLVESSAADVILKMTPQNGAYDPRIQLTGQDGNIAAEGFEIQYDNNVGDVYFKQIWNGITGTTPAMRFSTGNAADAMVVSGNGNVGIGTTTPTAKLEVAGAISATPTIFEVYPNVHNTSGATGYTKVLHNSVNLNTNPGSFTLNADNTVTVAKAGYYEIEQRILVLKASAGWTHSRLLVNGAHAGWLSHSKCGYNVTSWCEEAGNRKMYLPAGAVLTHETYQNMANTYTYHSGNANSDYTFMRIHKLN